MTETREYAIISLYLWVYFGGLFVCGKALLDKDQVQLLPMGRAAIKALIIGKIIEEIDQVLGRGRLKCMLLHRRGHG